MSNSAAKNALILFCLLGLSASLSSAQTIGGDKCGEPPAFYEAQNYSVREVKIETPLDWLLGSVDRKLTEILTSPSIPIKKGDIYHKANADAAFIKLKDSFPELTVNPEDRVAVRIARPGLANCNAGTKKLDVVFHVYTFSFSYYLSRVFERGRKDEVKRSVVDTSSTELLANYFPQPFVGYNRSRNVIGGTKLTIKQPGGPLDNISLMGSGSSSSAEAQATAAGMRDYNEGTIRHLAYQFRYSYSDIPGNAIKFKGSSGLGQLSVATRAFGSHELIVRFGGVVEGGNKQTDLDQRLLPAAALADSGYGSIKTFVGGTMTLGTNALKGSYGLQLGRANQGSGLDYIKQVFDTAADFHYLVTDHRPINLSLQFTAGAIHTRHRLPVGERFFGGNAVQNFIAGDDWIIPSGPFIRSFPQNRFTPATVGGIPGGDRFFSTNITLALTVWGKPLVPREILAEPDFPNMVALEFSTAESSLRNEYLSSTPEFRRIAEKVKPLSDALSATNQELQRLSQLNPAQELIDQISLCKTDLSIANDAAESIKNDLEGGTAKTADIRKLVVGFPTKRPPITPYVSDLTDDLGTLKDMPGAPTPNRLGELITVMENIRREMADAFVALDQSAVAAQAAQKAQNDMKYPRRVFSQLTREANLIAVSPVVIFDAARLWQDGRSEGIRYAMGGGLRLSIVSLDLTAGYAVNPHRRPGEGRGAVLLSMEVSNLFR
jgi:hypothetical protein